MKTSHILMVAMQDMCALASARRGDVLRLCVEQRALEVLRCGSDGEMGIVGRSRDTFTWGEVWTLYESEALLPFSALDAKSLAYRLGREVATRYCATS